MLKSDTRNISVVNEEMDRALHHSSEVIAKVGDSYKKRLKVAARVEMFPKLLEEIHKHREAMNKREM